VAAINDVGLPAEEVDPSSGEMIGNFPQAFSHFPQAFSHIGLINAAWAITQAQQRNAKPGPGRVAAFHQARGDGDCRLSVSSPPPTGWCWKPRKVRLCSSGGP
jgi:hypothetical protein